MRSTLAVFVAGAGLLLTASLPLAAHHSFAAEFDATKAVSLQGVVTKLDWMNPHIWIYLDTKDDSGTVAHWQCEGGPPNTLTRNGWSRDSLKVGDQATLKASAPRTGPIRAMPDPSSCRAARTCLRVQPTTALPSARRNRREPILTEPRLAKLRERRVSW